jgi:hypothetical protein
MRFQKKIIKLIRNSIIFQRKNKKIKQKLINCILNRKVFFSFVVYCNHNYNYLYHKANRIAVIFHFFLIICMFFISILELGTIDWISGNGNLNNQRNCENCGNPDIKTNCRSSVDCITAPQNPSQPHQSPIKTATIN